MKRCTDCNEICNTTGNVCLSCGGRLSDMTKEEIETYHQELERKLKQQKQREWWKEKITYGILFLSILIVLVCYLILGITHRLEISYLLLIVVLASGIFQVLEPRGAWEVNHFFSRAYYDALEPSYFGLQMIKVSGYFLIGLVDALVIFLLFVGE